VVVEAEVKEEQRRPLFGVNGVVRSKKVDRADIVRDAAIAEFERELIRSRVRSGLAAVRAKGKQLGRPKKILDTKRIEALRAKGVGWKRIAAQMGVGVGTIYRVALDGSKIRERVY
jgi:DNA invertase Pin-like site-specific DNA recombinase